MAILIGGYTFEGPYGDLNDLRDNSGIYVILTRQKTGGNYTVVDVGESGNVQDRLEHHDRRNCWLEHDQGELVVAVLYTPHVQQSGRREIEQALRTQYNPPCGDR